MKFTADSDAASALLYAWLKDTSGRDVATPEEQRLFDEALQKATTEASEFVFRRRRAGPQCAGALSRLLHRFAIAKLDLQQNVIRDAGCEVLSPFVADSASLTHLDLGSNDIGSTGARFLAEAVQQAKKLSSLLLGGEKDHMHPNRIDSAGGVVLAEAVRKSRVICHLDLSRNPLGAENQDAFRSLAQSLERSHQLQTLRLSCTGLNTETAAELARGLATNSALSALDLSGNDLGPAVAASIAAAIDDRAAKGARIALRRLDLRDNPRISDKGFEPLFHSLALQSAPRQPLPEHTLRALICSNCQVTDRACEVLARSLQAGAPLQHCDLSDNLVGFEGCAALANAIAGHAHLRILCLSRNKVFDDGACALAGCLEQNSVLGALELDEARVSDKGCVALGVAVVGNSALHTLRLSGNHISDEAGRAFATMVDKNRTLERVSVQGNQIDHATALRVKRTLKRNRELRHSAEPSRLQKEVIWLHYQGLQLEQANEELQQHRVKRQQLLDDMQLSEEHFQQERGESSRRIKELNDRIAHERQELEELRARRKNREDEFDKFQKKFDDDLLQLERKVAEDQQRKDEAQAALDAKNKELADLERERVTEEKRIRAEIQAKIEDTCKWRQKSIDYQSRIDALSERLRALEEAEEETKARGKDAGEKKRRRKKDEDRRASAAADG